MISRHANLSWQKGYIRVNERAYTAVGKEKLIFSSYAANGIRHAPPIEQWHKTRDFDPLTSEGPALDENEKNIRGGSRIQRKNLS